MSNTKQSRVREFLVWRLGESVDWDCTVSEVASDLGLSYEVVRRICLRRGWKTSEDFSHRSRSLRKGVDTLMGASFAAMFE